MNGTTQVSINPLILFSDYGDLHVVTYEGWYRMYETVAYRGTTYLDRRETDNLDDAWQNHSDMVMDYEGNIHPSEEWVAAALQSLVNRGYFDSSEGGLLIPKEKMLDVWRRLQPQPRDNVQNKSLPIEVEKSSDPRMLTD